MLFCRRLMNKLSDWSQTLIDFSVVFSLIR